MWGYKALKIHYIMTIELTNFMIASKWQYQYLYWLWEIKNPIVEVQ